MVALPSTVWLVHPVKHDLSALSTWGTIRCTDNIGYIFSDKLGEAGEVPPGFRANIRRAAAEFDPDTDFLVLVGDHLQLALFTAELIHGYGYFKALRFDSEAKGYVQAMIEL